MIFGSFPFSTRLWPATPGWVRWVSLIAGVLALTAPFFFAAAAVPLWGIVVGVWLVVRGRVQNRPAAGQRMA